MRRVLSILALLLISQAAIAQSVTFFSRAEGATLDGTHDFSAGDTTWDDAGPTVTFDAAAGTRGTNGILVNGFAENFRLDSSDAIFSPAQGCFAFLWRFDAWPAFAKIAMVRGSTTDYQFSIWTHATSNTLVMYRGNDEGTNVNFQLTGLSLATNTVYGIKACWNQATPILRLSAYSTPTTSPTLIAENTESTSWTVFPNITQSNGAQFGDNSGGVSTEDLHYDSIIVSSSYADPIQNYLQYTSYTQLAASPTALVKKRRRH